MSSEGTANCFFCQQDKPKSECGGFSIRYFEHLPADLEPYRHHLFVMCDECNAKDSEFKVAALIDFMETVRQLRN